MPEPQTQISPQQIALMVDIIGGLAGQYASSLVQTGQQQAPVVKSSPYHWRKFFTKKRSEVRPTRPESPQAPRVTAPKVHVPANPRPTASSQQPSRPLDFTPTQQVRTPPPQPPQDQHQILEEIKKETQHHLRPGGTELPHWIRVRQINRSVLSQYEAAGVGSLDELVNILNNQDYPASAVNLTLFHDDTSPFVILSEPKQTLESGGTPAVVVGFPYSNQVHSLETAFPGIHFMTSEEAPKEIEEAAASLPKPLPRQSPYAKGFRVKAAGEEGRGSSSRSTNPKQPSEHSQYRGVVSVTDQRGTKPAQQPQQGQTQQQKPVSNINPVVPKQPSGPQQTPASFQAQDAPLEIDAGDSDLSTRSYTPHEQGEDQSTENQSQENVITQEEGLHLIDEYLTYYNTHIRQSQSDYNRDLPDDEQLENAQMEMLNMSSMNAGAIGKVTVQDGTSFFYKGVRSKSRAENEVLVSSFAQTAGVPCPRVREVPDFATSMGYGNTGQNPILTSWIEGQPLEDIYNGFIESVGPGVQDFLSHPKAKFIVPLLEKVVDPEDIDLQLMFGFWMGVRDRHFGNYMVSGDRLVTIDHELSDLNDTYTSLRGIVNNDLFMVKCGGHVREWKNEEQMRTVPLSIDVAKKLLLKENDLIREASRTGALRGTVEAIRSRGELLREFINIGDPTFGGMMQAFTNLFPSVVMF